jgi:hypothetical protein
VSAHEAKSIARESAHGTTLARRVARERAARRKKNFCSNATFDRNHVAQIWRIGTTILQIFPELGCDRFFERDASKQARREPLILFRVGLARSTRDLEVTETDLAETFLGGRTVAKKKKKAAGKKAAPKKKATKKKKKK